MTSLNDFSQQTKHIWWAVRDERVFVCSDNMVAELESFTGLIQRVKGYVRIRHSHTLNSLAFLRSLRYIDGENLLDEYDHTHTHTHS